MTKKVLGGGLDVGEFFEDSQNPFKSRHDYPVPNYGRHVPVGS